MGFLLTALLSPSVCSDSARVAASQLLIPRIATLTFAEFSFQMPHLDSLAHQLLTQFVHSPIQTPLSQGLVRTYATLASCFWPDSQCFEIQIKLMLAQAEFAEKAQLLQREVLDGMTTLATQLKIGSRKDQDGGDPLPMAVYRALSLFRNSSLLDMFKAVHT